MLPEGAEVPDAGSSVPFSEGAKVPNAGSSVLPPGGAEVPDAGSSVPIPEGVVEMLEDTGTDFDRLPVFLAFVVFAVFSWEELFSGADDTASVRIGITVHNMASTSSSAIPVRFSRFVFCFLCSIISCSFPFCAFLLKILFSLVYPLPFLKRKMPFLFLLLLPIP